MDGTSHEVGEIVTRLGGLRSKVEELEGFLESVCSGTEDKPSFAEVERRIRELSAGVEREAGVVALESYEPAAEVVEHEGRQYRRMSAPSEQTYWAMAGGLRVRRHLYREVGVRNGPTIVPVELAAGIVEGRLTPEAAQATAFLVQEMPSREAEEIGRRLGVLQQSRTTMARTCESLGQRWEENRKAGEDHLMMSMDVPEEAAAVAVSVDRVSLPMEEPRRRPPGRPRKGAAKRPVQVAYRMAYCGVLTLYDSDGNPLRSIRYGRVPGDGADTSIVSSLAGDLHAILALQPELLLVALGDGAAEMQKLLDEVTEGLSVDARLIDFWHLVEKLAAAIKAAGRDPKPVLKRWKKKLLNADSAVQQILIELRTWGLEYEELPEALHQAITYLQNNGSRMKYATPRKAGLPIGSGHVEATCKTLVSTRMKRSGARWKGAGAQVILSLRSLAKSSRWDDAMDFLLETYRRPITAIQDAS
jgi:hypothetical protein